VDEVRTAAEMGDLRQRRGELDLAVAPKDSQENVRIRRWARTQKGNQYSAGRKMAGKKYCKLKRET
jgi:hypothetical protein